MRSMFTPWLAVLAIAGRFETDFDHTVPVACEEYELVHPFLPSMKVHDFVREILVCC